MKTWYIIAYDIRQPKRLRRLHYYLKKRAIALQNSVFLIRADRDYLQRLEGDLKGLANTQQDDLRIYPVRHPDTIWTAGKQASAIRHLYAGSKPKQNRKKKTNWFKNLFGWKP